MEYSKNPRYVVKQAPKAQEAFIASTKEEVKESSCWDIRTITFFN